jgi:hypothetical protein
MIALIVIGYVAVNILVILGYYWLVSRKPY